MKQYADRARRLSTLSRSDAIQQGGYQPIKQYSNPLPEHRRIYERDHTHSRSWNVETGHRASPPPTQPDDYQYYQMNDVYPPKRPYIPTINEPQVHLGVRQFHRQAKSFDDRTDSRDMPRISLGRRTVSDTRQKTAQLLQPETPVAAACQSLWAAKGHLEELHALGISDPSSASTSFESNTDNSPATGSGDARARPEPAHKKRLQYKLSWRKNRPVKATIDAQATESRHSPSRRSPKETPKSTSDRRKKRDRTKKETKARRVSITLPNKSGRRLTLHIPAESPTRRSSHESEASRELREIFRRRESQKTESRRTSQNISPGDQSISIATGGSRRVSRPAESRRTSRTSLGGPPASVAHEGSRRLSRPAESRRTSHTSLGGPSASVAHEGSRRESQDFQEFMRDIRRHSRDSYYEHERDNDDPIRREMETRWLADYIRDYYEVIQQRRKWRDMLYNLQNRRFLRELPIKPTLEDEIPDRRGPPASSKPRILQGMEPLYEKREQRQDGRRRRMRNTFVRRAALSHDAVFMSRKPEEIDDRSLFLRRKFLSTAAVSSLDSTNSTESSAPEAIFASSVDSANSDLEHRRLSLMNRIPTGSMPQMISRPIATINPVQSSQRRRVQGRDYSVDAQSDTLFREWSRVDPAYEGRDRRTERRRLDRGVSEDLRYSRTRPYARQLTANPGSTVIVPYICYPDEVNCSR